MIGLFAQLENNSTLPPLDSIDWIIVWSFVAFLVATLLISMWYLAIDFHACYRAWRKVLILVHDYLPHVPRWAKHRTPKCLIRFGLQLPCSQLELLNAYRRQVKTMHPDVGGDLKLFMEMQADFDQAKEFLASLEAVERT